MIPVEYDPDPWKRRMANPRPSSVVAIAVPLLSSYIAAMDRVVKQWDILADTFNESQFSTKPLEDESG